VQVARSPRNPGSTLAEVRHLGPIVHILYSIKRNKIGGRSDQQTRPPVETRDILCIRYPEIESSQQ
jgi:hypothetical protein